MFDGLLENHRSRVGAAARSILNGHLLTAAGAQTGVRWRPGERLHDLFERRCDELVRSGDGAVLAVDGPTARLSYAELDARANQLARWLRRSAGVVRGERVALLLPDPVEGYVAMLAVLKAGAAFVPLDPELPPARLAFMLEDAGARFALCTSQSAGALAPFSA